MRLILTIFFCLLHSIIAASAQPPFDLNTASEVERKGWDKMSRIVESIKKPTFKNQSFNIVQFGAVNDGKTDSYQAFKKAILTCNRNGGGKVEVPAGTFLVNGPIHLLSNVNLHLEKNSIIKFGTDPQYFTPLVKVRWEGVVCYNYSPLIYAYKQKNIAITGSGTIDGSTESTWSLWKKDNEGKNQDLDKIKLRQMGNDLVDEKIRVFGNGYLDGSPGDGKPHYLRPDLIQFYECDNILLDSVRLKSSPFWTVHPVFSKNITIANVTIEKGTTNDDGIDPESCENVLIKNCNISTSDDAISIKAGRDQDAWNRKGTKNVVIRNCVLNSEIANAFCIGSEMSGGVENVFLENCTSVSAENGVNFKCNLDRGGFIKNVFIRNYKMETCLGNAILFQMDYHSWRGGNFPPDFSGFYFSNVQCELASNKSINISGVKDKAITKVYFNDVKITKARELPEVRFAKDLLFRNVRINNTLWTTGK